MSDGEFVLWRAFDTISPIGGERADRHAALIATILANVNRDPKRTPTPFALDDFDLYKPPPPVKTREQEEAEFRAAFWAAGLLVTSTS
jgi:hypothetical protein